jgi:hypothetical protein
MKRGETIDRMRRDVTIAIGRDRTIAKMQRNATIEGGTGFHIFPVNALSLICMHTHIIYNKQGVYGKLIFLMSKINY